MNASIVIRLSVVLVALLAAPAIGYGQEATLTGTITDSTGGVLPGVTVTVSCTVDGAICRLTVAVWPTSS